MSTLAIVGVGVAAVWLFALVLLWAMCRAAALDDERTERLARERDWRRYR